MSTRMIKAAVGGLLVAGTLAVAQHPAAAATATRQAQTGVITSVKANHTHTDYQQGYRDGYRDGWRMAREECREQMPRHGHRNEHYARGYNTGFRNGFEAGFREYCR